MFPSAYFPIDDEDMVSSLNEIARGVLWMTIIPEDHNRHPLDTKVAGILVGNRDKIIVIGFSLTENVNTTPAIAYKALMGLPRTKVKLIADCGKSTTQYLRGTGVKFEMADALNYIRGGDPDYPIETVAHQYFHRMYPNGSKINIVIPLTKHIEMFGMWIMKQAIPTDVELKDLGYASLVNHIIPILSRMEEGGMHVDRRSFLSLFPNSSTFINSDNLFRCNYNPWSSTGRPSNTFGGVNLAALNKENDERLHFTSRFGSNGILLLSDFKSYHPHLLARLANYPLNKAAKADTYRWIATEILGKDDVTTDELKAVKSLTFQNLYGKIDELLLEVPYFAAIQKYVDSRWKFYCEHGYVETPIFNRQIKECHLGEKPFPNKVVNYLLQAYETERNLMVIRNVLDYLDNKKSKIVLYLYDSILIDFCMDDGPELVFDIRRMMEEGEFPISIKTGTDFKNMNNFIIPE
jgi:hypothetical protein